MPRKPQHALVWSPDEGLYELRAEGRAARRFVPGDGVAWQDWLDDVTAFAFHGASGDLNVHQEARPRGGRYWYAYRTAGGCTRKRYLGASAAVSLARLEEVAAALPGGRAGDQSAAPPVMSAPDVASLLPATKLSPPQLPPTLAGRGHLHDALDVA